MFYSINILLEKIRPFIFWIIDFLKGGKIRAHVSDIDFIFKNYSSQDALKLIDERREKILKHATETTLFYMDYKGYKSIFDFPVINKNIIRDRFNEFISDKFQGKDLISVTTSGSTGTPFKMLHDRNKKARHTADTIYFNRCAGYELGMRLYFIRNWCERFKRSKLKSWIQNIVPVSNLNLTEDVIASLINTINFDKSDKGLMGYPSSLETVCKYLEGNNLKPVKTKIKSVITISEELDMNTSHLIQKYFNVPVFSRYATSENGIIAQQIINGGNEFYVNSSGFYVEILNFDNDSPAKDENPGRIVVTDYFNYGMPTIRYDTGDIGIMNNKYKDDNIFRVLIRVEGRKSDMIFNTSGNYISPSILISGMWEYQDIKQYQIIQTGKGKYQLVLNCNDPYPGINKLINYFRKYLGDNAIIEIKYVNEIPLLSSGKRKTVLNAYTDSSGGGN